MSTEPAETSSQSQRQGDPSRAPACQIRLVHLFWCRLGIFLLLLFWPLPWVWIGRRDTAPRKPS